MDIQPLVSFPREHYSLVPLLLHAVPVQLQERCVGRSSGVSEVRCCLMVVAAHLRREQKCVFRSSAALLAATVAQLAVRVFIITHNITACVTVGLSDRKKQ